MTDEISQSVALSWHRLQTVKYVNVASLAILVFDYTLTFDLEVSLLWPSRFSTSKALFFLARYTPFFDVPVGLYFVLGMDIPLPECYKLNMAATIMSVFGIAIGEAILVLRTYALSEQRRRVLLVFGTIYGAAVVASVVLISIFLTSMVYGPPLNPLIPGCNETGGDFILVGVCFILVLVNETALMIYTIHLGWRKYRYFPNPFVVTLYRDGIIYFVFLFLGSAANFAILLGGEGELQELLNTFLRVMHSVLSTRVLLNLRDVERRRRNREHDGAELSVEHTVTGTRMDFANSWPSTSRTQDGDE
uniref:DUF6533 domain-containing protein n=1 Tax=Mycena chlorophos TaxID=658473 RepID=A0ABQ0KUD6_MYCCL|nr:predicted protein [Mycena chlorophos]